MKTPRKVAVLSPTTSQLVEKMAVLFPEGIDLVGPQSDDRHYWNNCHLRLESWRALGLKIEIVEKPFGDVDFSQYDLLVESAETFQYSKDWRKHCLRIECPILLKACWTNNPKNLLPRSYVKKVSRFPVLLEMPAHAPNWKAARFTDVNVIPNPVGDWWFQEQWTGAKEQVLFVLSGKDSWRGLTGNEPWKADPSWNGWSSWEELCRRFPGKTHHHDGAKAYKTPLEMAQLFAESRVFVNFDRPYGMGERPLTLAFTEALSAGLPVAAYDLPGLNYRQYIDSNGVCSSDFDKICGFISKCLTDIEFARTCGNRSREIARSAFSTASLRPKYEELIYRAHETFSDLTSKRKKSFSSLLNWIKIGRAKRARNSSEAS